MRGANIVRGELPAPEGKCVTALPASSLSSGVVQAPGDGPEDPDKAVLEKVPSVINQSSSSDPSLLASRTSAATPDLDPLPMLRPTATSPLCTPPAVELQEVLVQPSRTIDTGEHHKAYLDSFRPAAVEVQPLQLDQPAQIESELSTPKPNESREVTPGVDLPARSNQNGSLVEEAIAAAPPVRKRQAWRRSSTLVEDSTHKMTRPPRPSAQNRLQALSWRAPGSRNFPFSFSPSLVRERSVSAPPGLRRTPSEMFANSFSISSNSNQGLAAVKREMNKNEQDLLNKSNMWRLKTYYVFPLLSQLRHADHLSRIIFPAAYIIFVLTMLSEVNFGVQAALGHQLRCDSAGS